MGNCSTQKQNIIVPQQPGIIQTEFIKPEPSVFHIPMELHQPIQPQSNSSPLSKNTYLPSNPNLQPIELTELNSLKPNTLFADHVFKGQKKSIGQKLIIDHLEWKRPSQFLRQDPIIFQGEIQQYDLKQGRLQNSYFVSAFSLLGNTQEVFTEVLSNIFGSRIQQINVSQNGAYVLWLFVEGWWKKIVIDDLMPTSYGNYMFSNYRNQLWIWLIEKAYAKTFKSYENIQKGLLGPFLTTLTGAPYQYLNTKSIELISPDIAWQFVKQNMDSGYLLSVSTETCDRNKYFQRDSTFSYNVLDCQQVYILTTTKKKRQRILKLNNPWGRYEWKGRWSQYSDVWSEELRHQLDYEKADDSVMWINIEDLLKNFGQICSCKYKSDFINTSLNLKFKQQSSNQLKGIFIHISQRTQGYLSLIQPDHRHFPKAYSYSMSKLILLQMQKETKKPKLVLNQKIDFDHTCTFPIQLNPGLYYLILQMDWTCSFTRDATVNLYTDRAVYLKEDDKMPTGEQLFYQLVQIQQAHGKVLEVYEYPHDPNIKRITGVFGGYVYYHYFNESKDNKYLSETVKLGDSKNLVVVGESSPKQFAIKLLPGQEKLVKMKITKQGTGQYTFNPIVKNQVFQKFTMQSLLQMLKKKPTKSRQRDIESELIEVYIKTFQYSGGVALLYSNQMSKYSYIQQIVFDISNLKLENEVLQEGYKYNIELEPHQQKVLSFVIIDPSKSFTFKTKVEYYLGTPEFKF